MKKSLLITGIILSATAISGGVMAMQSDPAQSSDTTKTHSQVRVTTTDPESPVAEALSTEVSAPDTVAPTESTPETQAQSQAPVEDRPLPAVEPKPVVIASYSTHREGDNLNYTDYCDITYSDSSSISRMWKNKKSFSNGSSITIDGDPCEPSIIGQAKSL